MVIVLLILILNIICAITSNVVDTIQKWNINPYHSKVLLNSIEDILNPIPITIEFIMSTSDFEKYGALFHYQITKDSIKYDVDYEIHQFQNNIGSMKTQISNLKITWDQLSNAKLEDFINKPLGILVSYHDPALTSYMPYMPSQFVTKGIADFNVKYWENAILFYSPSHSIIFNQVPSFFWSKDYGSSQSKVSHSFVIMHLLGIYMVL